MNERRFRGEDLILQTRQAQKRRQPRARGTGSFGYRVTGL